MLNILQTLFNNSPAPKGRAIKPKKAHIHEDINMPTVFDGQGVQQKLAPLLAKGGEGMVYPLEQRPNILVKCYNEHVLSKDQKILKEKITAMCSLRSKFKSDTICWPAIMVYNQQKNWLGYAMTKFEGKTLRTLAHAIAYKKYTPHLNRQNIVSVLIDLLENIQVLHEHKVMIGDYNLSNFMWHPQTFKVGFIDCDSYQIQVDQRTFPCLVGSPDLTAPEHHGKAFKNIIRTPQSEYFSIAIILFMCLMLGRHPYDMIGGSDPVENLKSGKFAYGLGNTGIPKGQWYNIWSHMPYRLKSLFIQTFTEGVSNPQKRVDIKTWLDALKVYQRELNKGYHDKDLIPAEPKKSKKS